MTLKEQNLEDIGIARSLINTWTERSSLENLTKNLAKLDIERAKLDIKEKEFRDNYAISASKIKEYTLKLAKLGVYKDALEHQVTLKKIISLQEKIDVLNKK